MYATKVNHAVDAAQIMGIALLLCSFVATPVVADQATTSSTRLNSGTSDAAAEITAAWGITSDEYVRYTEIMAGKRGAWSPNADPILVLGTHATSVSERRRFAEKYVQQEFERTERELAFQRAVSVAWKRLFPDTPRIGSPMSEGKHNATLTGASPVQRIAIIVTQDCAACRPVVQRYLEVLKGQGALNAVDVYISDSEGNDRVLQNWVTAEGVDIDLLKTGKVTVNHAESHSAVTEFPTIFELRDGGTWRVRRS